MEIDLILNDRVSSKIHQISNIAQSDYMEGAIAQTEYNKLL